MKSLKQNFKSIMLGNTRRLLTVLCVLTIGVGQMWGSGYNSQTFVFLKTNNGTTYYYEVTAQSEFEISAALPDTWGGVFSEQTFNNVHNLQLKGGAVGGWTSYGEALSGTLYYAVTQSSSTPDSWTELGSIASDNVYQSNSDHCYYYKNNYSNEITPHTPGTYYLHIKITDGASNDRTSSVEFTVPPFTVAGSEAVLGSNWAFDDESNDMTWSSGTTWTLTKSNVSLSSGTTYEFKVGINHSSSEAYPGSNKTFTVGATGHYDVTFSFNALTHAVADVVTTRLYAVTYDGNGNTSGSDSFDEYYPNGATVTVAEQGSLAKSNYTFEGWNTVNNGTGTNYTAGSGTFTKTAETQTIYAKWTQGTTLNANGGTSNTTYTATWNGTTIAVASTPTRTGYTLNGYYKESGCSNLIANTSNELQASTTYTNSSSQWSNTSAAPTLYAGWTANDYTITFDPNDGGSVDPTSASVTYDAAISNAPIPTKTGYTFTGYNTAGGTSITTNAGVFKASIGGFTDASAHWIKDDDVTITAQWEATSYTVTLDIDEDNHGTIADKTTSQSVTYDASTTTVPALPTAANGYCFMGFFTSAAGGGTKVINADGTWIASVDGYTDGSKNWVHAGNVTLYAYYKKAEITIVLSARNVAPEATITATPTISPTPTGDTKICWFVLYGSTDNPLAPQPTFTPVEGNIVSFPAPSEGGSYKVKAVLRTGTVCGSGTALDSAIVTFTVAASHNVTVRYKCGDEVIMASGTISGKPLEWSSEITAPDIFGYTFASWSAGDGVTLTDDDGSTTKTSTTNATIKIKAVYDGYLTATYTQKNHIYFVDNLGWTNPEDENAHVYLNLLTSDYWDNTYGSGNYNRLNRNLPMDRVPGTTNIFYYNYGDKSTSNYISFTKESYDGYGNFNESAPNFSHVVFPSRSLDASGTDNATGLGFYSKTPMFVPVADQTPLMMYSGRAAYYNAGYWTKYTNGTGYTLEVYYNDGSTEKAKIAFTSKDDLMPMKAKLNLDANHTYKFRLKRDGDVTYENIQTMNYGDHGQLVAWEYNQGDGLTGLSTTVAGDYTFHLSYSAYNRNGTLEYRLRIAVDYPLAAGDYRLLYKDNIQTKWFKSAIVPKSEDESKVSFFVRTGQSAELKLQRCTNVADGGAVTWEDTIANLFIGGLPSAITKDSVYVFTFNKDADGKLQLASTEAYTGNYYIRTDVANSKWDNWTSDPDHVMTYSEYSINHGGYSHYYCHWVQYETTGRKNVKFCIANDYSPSISDTLIRENNGETGWENINNYIESNGDLKRDANVRFMWNRHDNTVSRAYVDGAYSPSNEFLTIRSSDSKISIRNYNNTSDSIISVLKFSDNGNWIYEANVKALPNAQIKLLSIWGAENTITQYFKGSSGTTEPLIGGSGENWYDIRIIYDYKSNRLVASWLPSGEITKDEAINADVMFIRDHQEDIAQVTFEGVGSKISAIESAYAVLRFNKWTLNNKETTGGHSPLDPLLSRYERDIYYISFPFRVSMEDVFGFGTYGKHWIIEEYDGAGRAANGYWLESGPNWKFVTNRKGKFFEPYMGYIIALDLDELGETSDVWTNTDQVELYFPSYGTMPDITKTTVNCTIPEHLCTINRSEEIGGNGLPLGPEYDRRVKDSHWNVISVPTYVNIDNVTFANTDWITTADETHVGPNFLYEWNPGDNSVTIRSGSGYTYMAMHAYLVQYCGVISWNSTSGSPATAPRRNPAYRGEYECRLELQQNEQIIDQTYIRLMDDEHVTNGFEFNYDASKEFNRGKANIYTLIGSEPVAGNCMPMSNETTVVPVGVKIATDGEYTFSLPDGTEGIGVVLIDNATNTRTNLGLTDYNVYLEAGNTEGRFVLEIPAISQTTTDINDVQGDDVQGAKARKVMIDGMLYIVKDGKVFDARGARVE